MTLEAATQGYPPIVTVEPLPFVRNDDGSVTMQPGAKWDKSVMRVNQRPWIIRSNVRRNIRRHLPQLAPHEPQPRQHIAIVGGGWSLNDPATFEELRELYFTGVKLVALNGAGNWLMERNMRPSMQIVLDSRPENVGFVAKPIQGCRYLLASQCDGILFEACEDRDLTIFHLYSEGDPITRRLDNFYAGRWTRVPTAGTVGVVAPMLCRILGFEFQHIFGMDSCYDPQSGAHHAYPQALNDAEGSVDFKSGDRVFRCSAWQASQAQTFMEMIGVHADLLSGISVHGDGLIAHLMQQAALEGERSTIKEA